MRVRLVEARQWLNANYSRANGLRFYRQRVAGREIFSCESPDVVCHELGHAILDALRPQLFHVASTETGAFHESFGDMTAILCALQIPQMRTRVIAETGGGLNRNSRLSRVAEQLGWGIRQLSPTAVDSDSLRNAANRFFYRRPDLLPPSAPANLLSSAVHSFSRVFTGAFLDALAWMFSTTGSPAEANLAAVARDMGRLLVDGVHAAPVTTAYFSQVAAAMVRADQVRFAGRYRSALTRAFVERGILSVSSSVALGTGPELTPTAGASMVMDTMTPETGSQMVLAYAGEHSDEGFRQGFGETPELPLKVVTLGNGLSIEVHSPEGAPRFASSPAVFGAASDGMLDDDGESRVFVEGLIYRGELSLGSVSTGAASASATAFLPDARDVDLSRVTHSLVDEDGKMVLRRNHFSCCLCRGGNHGAQESCS
jgi:hypothetical protein